MKQNKNNIWTKWLYWFVFAVAVIVVYKTLDNFEQISIWVNNFFKILMPFFAGILIAYLLYVPCKKIENLYKNIKFKFIKNRAKGLSVLTTYLIVTICLILAINFVIPVIAQSIIDLTNNVQSFYTIAINKFNNLPSESIIKSDVVKGAIENIKGIDLKQFINIDRITEYAKGVISIATSIFDVFVAIIVSVYILLERKEILNFIRKIVGATFEEKTCNRIAGYFNRTNEIFFKFIASQFIDAIIIGILLSVAMSFMGIKYAILLGVMIGLFNMIPYFGAIIAVGISIIITIFTGGLTKTIWMAIVIIVLQQIDANIINPKIVGNSLKISPLLVIFAVTIGGAYFGIIGMFLAVPIVAVIKIFVMDYIEYRNKKN